jgi:pyruvate dehydrogenase E2 component (dihydrolipoamide acetyltransferase)
MAVGASKPTVSADKDGFFSVKSKMLVGVGFYHLHFNCYM